MKTTDFDYVLPEELIAQTPTEPRDHARLLVTHMDSDVREHRHFYDLPEYLHPGDALVINETRVIPARLLGVKSDTGVPVEVLLLKRIERDSWEALVKPGRRLKQGVTVSDGTVVFGGNGYTGATVTGGSSVSLSEYSEQGGGGGHGPRW